MIFHLVLNSLFVFFALTLLIELFLFVFRIKNARLRTICRLFPIVKLPFDIFIFSFFGESLFVNFNPFSCEVYLKEFITKLLPMKGGMGGGAPTIIPEYIAAHIPSFYFKWLTLGIASLSLFTIFRKAVQLIKSRTYLKKVLLSASPCRRFITNGQLREKLANQKAVVLISEETQVPFAAGLRHILFPSHLLTQLSQEEFETVIAHELEHLRWKDPILKLISSITCSLFWWIPTQWWIKRLEADQECACDLGIHQFGMDTLDLASAFVKTAKNSHFEPLQMSAMSAFASKGYSHACRLQNIVNSQKTACGNLVKLKFAAGIGMCLLAFVCFWIC